MSPSQYPNFVAQPVLAASKKSAVNASATYAGITGDDLPAGTRMLRVCNESDTTLRFNIGAAADANCAGIPQLQVREFWGSEAELATLQFYTGSSEKNVSFEAYKF